MARWSDCMKFEEYNTTWRDFLVNKAGVYQFGYWYTGFIPKYIGRVLWTDNGWDFYQRFYAYDYGAHNPEIKKRIEANRKGLWFRIMSVQDPAWTESKMLLEDTDADGNYQTFEWNKQPSYIAERRDRENKKAEHSHAY